MKVAEDKREKVAFSEKIETYFQIEKCIDLKEKSFADERIIKGIRRQERGYGQYEMEVLHDLQKSIYGLVVYSFHVLFYKYNGHTDFIYGVHFMDKDSIQSYLAGPEPDFIHQRYSCYSQPENRMLLYAKPWMPDHEIPVSVAFYQKEDDFYFQMPDQGNLRFCFTVCNNILQMKIIYNLEYSNPLIRQIGNDVKEIISKVSVDEEISVSSITLKHLSLNKTTEHAIYESDTLIRVIEQMAESDPKLVIYEDQKETVTYDALLQRVNQFCNFLETKSIGKIKMGLLCERSVTSMAAILAVIKTGGLYVPVASDMPLAKMRSLFVNAGINFILCEKKYQETLGTDIDYVAVEDLPVILDSYAITYTNKNISIFQDICILYTSGTTGEPKIVKHDQYSIWNAVLAYDAVCDLGHTDVIGQRSPFQHIPSTIEIFIGLIKKIKTVIIPDEVLLDHIQFMDYINRKGITWIQLVPSLIRNILLDGRAVPSSIRYLITLGEELNRADYDRLIRSYPEFKMINNYGMTEINLALLGDLNGQVDADRKKVQLGRPIANSQAVILNDALELVPKGIFGKIGIIHYYQNRKLEQGDAYERYAEYVNELECKVILTGDYGNYIEGTDYIEYEGRSDSLCKINGKRVDISYIENVISSYGKTEECAVMKQKRAENMSVTAFIVFQGHSDDSIALRKYLSGIVESYMIPEKMIALSKLPKTKTGKINRKELEKLLLETEAAWSGSAKESVEELLCRILGCRKLDDFSLSFKELGMDSLQIMQFTKDINKRLDTNLKVTDVFNNPTPEKLVLFLHGLKRTEQTKGGTPKYSRDVAVIGMSGLFPGNKDIDGLWKALTEGKDLIVDFPKERKELLHIPAEKKLIRGGYLRELEYFHSLAFGITPREASYMDPQQQAALIYAWKAIEDAGYSKEALEGTDLSVYIGVGGVNDQNGEEENSVYNQYTKMGSDSAMIPARITYCFNWHGAAVALNTACSSGLSALYYAYQDIIAGNCRCSLAGGIHIIASERFFDETEALGMFSFYGDCRPFDEHADGIVPGEAVGFVMLKSMQDAIRDHDHIYAVIKGASVNQDGKSNGITAPNGSAQELLARNSLEKSGIDPGQVVCVEAHGTGTKLGDPIEFDALSKVYEQKDRVNYCALSSIKANIGHTIAASGMVGFIKSCLSLKHSRLAPQIKFDNPNPLLQIISSPFYVNQKKKDISKIKEPVISVNSFGYSGTNVNVLVAGAIETKPKDITEGAYMVPVSAQTETAFRLALQKIKTFLSVQGSDFRLRDFAYTMQTGRTHFKEFRKVFIAADAMELAQLIERTLGGHTVDCAPGSETENEQLFNIAKLYETGNTIDWQSLYEGETPFKVSIPVFSYDLMLEKSSAAQERKEELYFYESDPEIGEHEINGQKIVPAAKIIEIVKGRYESNFKRTCSGLQDIYFIQPLIVQEKLKTVLFFSIQNNQIEFKITDCMGKLCVKGKIDSSAANLKECRYPEGLILKFPKTDIYGRYQECGITYGNHYRLCTSVEKVEINHRESSAAVIERPEADGYFWVLDAAMHSAAAIFGGKGGAVPFYIGQMIWHRDFGSSERYISISNRLEEGLNIDIYNQNKEPVAALMHVVLAVSAPEFYFYKNQWKVAALDWESVGNKRVLPDIIIDRDGYSSSLFEDSGKVYNYDQEIHFQDSAEKVDILYFASQKPETYYEPFFHMLQLIRQMYACNIRNVNFIVVVPGGADMGYVLNSSLSGLLGVMHNENKHYSYVILELPLNQKERWKTVIASEYVSGMQNEFVRYNEKLERFRLERIKVPLREKTASRLRRGGTYLITGGCGGIGRILARFLAEKYQANLVLTGRSPQNAEIEGFLSELNRAGASAKYLQADMADYKFCHEAFNTFAGDVSGVIDCCGVIMDHLLVNKNEQEVKEVLDSKIIAAVNLYQIFRNRNLDFMALFSSVSAELFQIGQSDYAYANKFISNFADGVDSKFHIVSIAWGYWEEGGMRMTGKSLKKFISSGHRAITAKEGCELFERIINSPEKNIIVY